MTEETLMPVQQGCEGLGSIKVILGIYWGHTRVMLGLYWGYIRVQCVSLVEQRFLPSSVLGFLGVPDL